MLYSRSFFPSQVNRLYHKLVYPDKIKMKNNYQDDLFSCVLTLVVTDVIGKKVNKSKFFMWSDYFVFVNRRGIRVENSCQMNSCIFIHPKDALFFFFFWGGGEYSICCFFEKLQQRLVLTTTAACLTIKVIPAVSK